jgi:hypothetical protein
LQADDADILRRVLLGDIIHSPLRVSAWCG